MKAAIFSLFTFFSFLGYSQDYKLGNVTKAELLEKVFQSDTSAVAAYYFKSSSSFFPITQQGNFKIDTRIKEKIKIYKKEGYEYGTIKIPFFTGSGSQESIELVSAFTYNLDSDQIVKSKVKDEGIFITKINDYWSLKTFVFPNVKEGCILEIELIIHSPRFATLPEFLFQEEIPVQAAKFHATIPEYFLYRFSTRGNYSPKYLNSLKSRSENQSSWTFKENVFSYELFDVPALPDEPFVANPNNYRSAINTELASIKQINGLVTNYATDWQSVAQAIYSADFSEQIAARNFYETDLDEVLKNYTSEKDRLLATIKFLKSKVVWNNFYGIYTNDGIKSAYKKKSGNFAEVNLLLINMLQHIGIKADPVLISTRSNGIPLFPSRDAFNGVICLARIGNEELLIDATDDFPIPNLLPARDLNWVGRYISKEGFTEEVNLMPTKTSVQAITLMGDLNADGTLKGNMRKQRTEHFAKNYSGVSTDTPSDAYLEKLERELFGATIDSFKSIPPSNDSQTYVETFSFETTSICDIVAGKLLIKPLLFYTTSENPFKQDIRESPIDFNFPKQFKYMYILKIPEGYQVEALPEPVSVSLEDKSLAYKLSITFDAAKITITSVTDFNQPILPAEAYPAIKAIFAKMVEAEKQRIVLAKKS
ncbi:DUF3857 domain-containing protein [Flavobacterium aurantiibacter]|uniref:DUF3857 domain-containing protein n=1 Tax=Flavobacterium aurantiibacter TaxID=2023067 RepID=A0A255ZUN8_9FLAO|nr:DUF3857 domain-containing protein [Flavobacterium aurantiibacter]OYQ45099.1 hypothetical protein CHX27_06940 [Flavobacterium aurantiibacter]